MNFKDKIQKNPIFGELKFNLKQGNSLLGHFLHPSDLINHLTKNELDLDYLERHQLTDVDLEYPLFHWFFEFEEVLADNNGFNIILTNPPYIGESGNKILFRTYGKALPEYYEGKADLWYYFLQRSIDLLSDNGYCSFIAPNYWVTASGASKLRSRLSSEVSLIRYINFNQNLVFNSAQGVHINILILKKDYSPDFNVSCTIFNKQIPPSKLVESIPHHPSFFLKQRELIFEDWDPYFHFIPNPQRKLIEYIISKCVKLKNNGFSVKEGIVTGMNTISGRQISRHNLSPSEKGKGVFILDINNPDDARYIESLSTHEKSILKPFYKNSDIKKYYSSISTVKRIQYVNRNSINIADYPRVESFLNSYRELLIHSLDNPPYINRPRNPLMFSSPKLITPQRSISNMFAFNSHDWYAGQDVYYILHEENNIRLLKTLLIILNSKLAYFWFYWMGKRKGNQLELFSEPLGFFPIPSIKENPFPELADILLQLTRIQKQANSPQVDHLLDFFREIAEMVAFEYFFAILIYEREKNLPKYPLITSVKGIFNKKDITKMNIIDLVTICNNFSQTIQNNDDIGHYMKKIANFEFVKIIEKANLF